MLFREVVPLSLLFTYKPKAIYGRTRLQKLVFVVQEQKELKENKDKFYNFIPYAYGPFSKELYEDLDHLISEGYVSEERIILPDEKETFNYKIKDKGGELINRLKKDEKFSESVKRLLVVCEKVQTEYGHIDLNSLIRKVYEEFPDYSTMSIYEF